MKYYIAFIFNGSAARYHQKLVREVGPQFGENKIFDSKNHSHVTLKYPFEADSITEVEEIVKKVAKKHKKSKVIFNGFGNFRRFVAYFKSKFSAEGVNIQKELMKSLRKLKWLKIGGRDLNWEPHSTISYGFTKKNFDNIWKYLNSLTNKEFVVYFDNITILKKSRKYWKIYRAFKLK